MTDEVLAVLRSIDSTLKQLLALSQQRTARTTEGGKAVASDRDLDGQYGNPEVRLRDPKDWSGPTMKGRRFSTCPPEYLDLIAERCEFFATKDDEKGEKTPKGVPRSKYHRADAARARGWAARLRAGWTPPAAGAAGGGEDWPDASKEWQ